MQLVVKMQAILLMLVCSVQSLQMAIADNKCNEGKSVFLLLHHSVNRSGHPQLNARLEQYMNEVTWQLDLELSTTSCLNGETKKIITFTLNGLPQISGPVQFGSGGRMAHLGRQPLPVGYVAVPGLGYMRPSPVALPWIQAQAECNAEGATLPPLPANQRARETLVSIIDFAAPGSTDHACTWLGANDFEEEGKWIFTKTGLPIGNVTTLEWNAGTPTNERGHHCMAMHRETTKLMNLHCQFKFGFACYIPFET